MNRILLTSVLCITMLMCAGFCFAEEAATNSTKEKNVVKLETSLGTITITLNAEKAPLTVANFKKYVADGFYDGTIFHRVIPGFMVQGGGFTADMAQKAASANIKNEANNGLLNNVYSLAMARTNDPHSASAQFFINVAKNDFLNHKSESGAGWGYAVFGEVTEGKDIVDKIAAVSTGTKAGHQDVPTEAVTIIKATLVE